MQPDWRNLPAGPELDALVAEWVLGWQWVQGNVTCKPDWRWERPDGSYDRYVIFHDPNPANSWPRPLSKEALPPLASSTWEGMGQVVEAMEARGFCLHLERRYSGGPYVAWFSPPCVQVESATAPLAVCGAALVVLEVADATLERKDNG